MPTAASATAEITTPEFSLKFAPAREGVWCSGYGSDLKPGWYVTRYGETDGPFTLEEAYRVDAGALHPFRKAGEFLSAYVERLASHRARVAQRRADGKGGYHIDTKYFAESYEVFAETREQCQRIIDQLLRAYPAGAHYTRFTEISEIDGEFIAYGSRTRHNMRTDT